MDGILPLYKPKGLTSHDCVMKIRKIFQTKKVGHTGTLDPEVDGVLPICIGRATKISEYLTAKPKTYKGTVTLGAATDTEDATGSIIEQISVSKAPAIADIETVIKQFTGTITQVPPMYSAVKVKGKKLYEYAREGVEIERPKREVTIYDLSFHHQSVRSEEKTVSFDFTVTCSKGTYVRTLAVDMGRALGYPAHMSALTRTASGNFTIEECVTFEELEQAKKDGSQEVHLLPISTGLKDYEKVEVDREIAEKVLNGGVFERFSTVSSSSFLISYQGEILAIYTDHPKKRGMVKPETMLGKRG
ncbi:tRNA pseudouridine(55) synthase TruB [Thalassobacillus sp. C254]|uniref:tRNA pseudouridine(55) synthase TruB n=1 Tax=Thalassobacillus sp. C254 TaxID=1225341 RepID=UPI0006D25E05|nr:tRNA pseudouridine(55) synthase TruB [Thalassobacillus sp. C254]